ncbi:type I-E CRISPR-associated protein Cas6/Cse3/CasE [Corynebacterium sp.]|uniref:type I-E CRISPR-associated protein Cas6/Cse3/CasE n=1 Tax=Corynebacterium sp. TaxID=1720 RepID=UPI002A913BAB|nr:type I-E CRISPR-associated protein Cas6/Cse3/CasE [Corynebacterium sp.]MDY5786510.1 type I-E CRISPR-associated protein Cas6/Cse3/CasE [Corynebacterium sp.]
MTTLTRILLNPQTRGGRKLMTDPQSMHAAVRSAFPPDIDESNTRVLWRLDHREHEHILYIVGPEKPSCGHIVEQAGWDTRPAQSADYTRFQDTLVRGQRWRFELVANPTYSEWTQGKRGKVKAHVSAAHQLGWLHKRAGAAGFALAPLDDAPASDEERARWSPHDAPQVYERWTDTFYRDKTQRGKGTGQRPVRIAKARFAGTLEVTDAEALRKTLSLGIGRARGYGCGLLTLARMS